MIKSEGLESAVDNKKIDPIQKSIGHFGKWQLLMCLLLFSIKIPGMWHQINIIFFAPPISFECIDTAIDKCDKNCTEIIYDRSIFKQTIQMEWNLICDYAQLANLTQTSFMFGIMIGSLLFGWLSDKFGRRSPLVFGTIIQLIFGVATAFVPWFWLFCAMRFVTGIATGGTMIVSFVLIMELIGDKWRELVSILYQVPLEFAHASLPLLAWIFPDWRHLQLVLSSVSVVFISYHWLLPESPKWLLAIGRVDDAAIVLQKAAKINNLPTECIRSDLNLYVEKQQLPLAQSNPRGKFIDLIRTPNMRKKTILICFNWFACGLLYFGLSQYIGQIAGNIYFNVFLSACIATPGFLLTIIFNPLIGRRNTLAIAAILAGICLISIAFLPEWQIQLTMLAMPAACTAFSTAYLYSGELFPTVIRNNGIGLASTSARIGPMIAPFVLSLGMVEPVLPPIILGIVPLISGVSVFMLPETRGHTLPATVEEGESFGKKINHLERI